VLGDRLRRFFHGTRVSSLLTGTGAISGTLSTMAWTFPLIVIAAAPNFLPPFTNLSPNNTSLIVQHHYVTNIIASQIRNSYSHSMIFLNMASAIVLAPIHVHLQGGRKLYGKLHFNHKPAEEVFVAWVTARSSFL
jgi:hypothetical protein